MDWTQVITHPLGLAGFALALVFGIISAKGSEQVSWLAPVAASMAVLALAGGLYLSYLDKKPKPITDAESSSKVPAPSAATLPPSQPPSSDKSSAQATGTGSVAVSGSEVRGGINVNVQQVDKSDKK